MNRCIALVLVLLSASAPAVAQERSQAELKKLRAEKLAKPVFTKAAWLTGFDEAKQKAKEQGKPLLVYFTRSYSP